LNKIPEPAPIKRRIFFRHFGHLRIGSSVIDWDFSKRYPHDSHSYSYV